MPPLHRSERALRILADAPRQQYICRACRAQQIRSFHSSYPTYARNEKPLLTRLREGIFGSTEITPAEQKREDVSRERTKALAQKFDAKKPLERRKPSNRNQWYEIAAVVDPTVNKEYNLKSTWKEIERVGGEQWMKARVDKGEAYKGFLSQKTPQLSNELWQCLLHNVVTEVMVLQKAGRDVNQVWYPRGDKDNTYVHTARIDAFSGIEDAANPSEAETKILGAISEQLEGSNTPSGSQDGLKGVGRKLPDTPWLQTRLDDPNVKLAVAKRITQLTGRRVPDPVISDTTTVQSLFDALKSKDKPQKLAQTEPLQRLAVDAPNVRVHSTRQTMIHKEKRVGRWKVIESELEARDLPVTGNRWPQSKTLIEPELSRLDRKLRRMNKAAA